MVAIKSSGSAWVQPAAPVQTRTIPCSSIENICAPVHHSLAIFFRVQENVDALLQYEYLRQGLSRALCQQDIWAGTLQQDERGAFLVYIPPAPNAGVLFHYRDLSRDPTLPTFADFERAGFPYANGDADGLAALRPQPFPATKMNEPSFATQLTCIKGGMVLTSSFSHLLTDVVRARDFLVLWASCTRAVMAGSQSVPSALPFELNDTSRLIPKPRGPATPESMQQRSKDLPNFKLMDMNDPIGTLSELQNWQPKAHIPRGFESQEEYLRTPISGVWRFPKAFFSAASEYKAAFACKGVKVSSMDVLTAFLWSRLYLAKYPSTSATTPPAESTIVSAVDIRHKLNPPLPSQYQGAAVDLIRTTMPSHAILRAAAGSVFGDGYLKDIAVASRKAQAAWNEDQYMSLLELTQQTALSPGFVPRGPIDFLVTDHRGFRASFEANWGPVLGAGVAWREPYIGRAVPAGEIEFMPGPAEGEIDAFVSGERVVLERLSADIEMQKASRRQFLGHDFVKSFRREASRQARL